LNYFLANTFHKKKFSFKKLISIFVIIFIIIVSWYLKNINSPFDKNNSEKINFKIKNGQTAKQIAQNLEDEKIINSNLAFYLYIRLNKLSTNLKSGLYKLSPSENVKSIANQITEGKNRQGIITIPEGYTIRDIDKLLTQEGLINENNFYNCTKTCDFSNFKFLANPKFLEGYLFPDTYYVDPVNFDIKAFINLLLRTFEKKLLAVYEKSNSNRSLNDVVKMASIIEKEVRTEKDLAIVSGILWKRLDNDWYIGADATLLYLAKDKEITKDELEDNNPYNSRKIKGLPPTAIGNPGEKTFNAALNPTETDYWFYLTVPGTGEVKYAKTNEEQNINREKYL